MSRFFKSAAFPILIVVVLAFFAVKLVNPGSTKHRSHTYQTLVATDIPQGEVKSVELKNKGNAARSQAEEQRKLRSRLHRPGRARTDQGARKGRRPVQRRIEQEQRAAEPAHLHPAVRALPRLLDLPDEPGPGRRLESDVVRQVARQAPVGRLAEDHLPRRRRRGRGRGGAARDQGVPREPQEVPGARRAHPHRRAAVRAAGHRQDAARARRRRRGGRAVLLDLGLGLRRDVRRRRRLARARPVRAGQAELAPASSSWTRSTPSGATAAPASAAATTSASRRSTSCWSRWTASRRRTTSS